MSGTKKQDKDKGNQLIRNSTTEFLIFTGQADEQSVESRYQDETIWLSQKLMDNSLMWICVLLSSI